LYELCIYLAGKCGDLYRQTYASEAKSKKFVAPTRLHGNAILLAGEGPPLAQRRVCRRWTRRLALSARDRQNEVFLARCCDASMTPKRCRREGQCIGIKMHNLQVLEQLFTFCLYWCIIIDAGANFETGDWWNYP